MKPKKVERSIGDELIQAAKEIKPHKESNSHPKIARNDIIATRNNLKLSQSQFAALLGVSKRTLSNGSRKEENPCKQLNASYKSQSGDLMY